MAMASDTPRSPTTGTNSERHPRTNATEGATSLRNRSTRLQTAESPQRRSHHPISAAYNEKRRELLRSASTQHDRPSRQWLLHASQHEGRKRASYLTQQQNSIHQSLERTRNLLSQNLDRTSQSMVTLRSSSDTLQRTFTTHQEFGTSLSGSKGLLQRIKMAEYLDQYLTIATFIIFVLVVLYVEESRIGLLRFFFHALLYMTTTALGISSWFSSSETAT